MDDDNGEVQIQRVKIEFPTGNHRETDINDRNVGPELEMNDTEMDAKPSLPLYNLYPMNIKEELSDPDPPFFSLTSVVKSETDIGQLDTQYFDHSSIILQNLKREPDDEEENCVDPLCGVDSVPHGKTPGTSIQVLGQYSSEEAQSAEESNCCRLCKQSYSGKEECERERTCEKCLMAASKPNEQKMGRTGDKKKSYRCETCGKSFASNFVFTNHMRTHTGEKPFECETCGKCFAQISHLTGHRKTHSGEKPFGCETCNKRFGGSSTLKRHMRSHTGNKPYECETCGKCFSASSDLTRHKRTHSGEKPIKCDACGKCFASSWNLTSHRRTHSGEKPFKCESCGTYFADSSNLRKHKMTHSDSGTHP